MLPSYRRRDESWIADAEGHYVHSMMTGSKQRSLWSAR
jgi:hypothetical protein